MILPTGFAGSIKILNWMRVSIGRRLARISKSKVKLLTE